MSTTKILHNPRCSKSRQTLALLEEQGIAPEIVKYLESAPSVEEIFSICSMLGKLPLDIIRTKEALFAELGLKKTDSRSDTEWAELMHANPKLIERPIVVHGDKAAIGRPPEDVLALF